MAQSISILDIGSIVFEETELTDLHLLASNMVCSSCNSPMTQRQKLDISNGFIFRCGSCQTTKSLRTGSFFSKSKPSSNGWWVREYPVTDAAEEAKVGRDTAIDVYQYFRELCPTKLIQLGSPGKVIQIHESLFRHKPKVWYDYIN